MLCLQPPDCVLLVPPSACHMGDVRSGKGMSPVSYTLPDGNRTSSDRSRKRDGGGGGFHYL